MKRHFTVTSAFVMIMLLLLVLFHHCAKEEEPKTVADIDGNIYNTLQIGAQTWIVENLKTARYRNGDTIHTTYPPTLDITQEDQPAYQWPYEGDEWNVHVHGRLYTWYTVTDSRNLCPEGWHVPTDAELTSLENFIGGMDITGSMSDFLAGYRTPEGLFDSVTLTGYWWTATASGEHDAWIRRVNEEERVSVRLSVDKKLGLAVKCLKD